jgi:hypothetical protein
MVTPAAFFRRYLVAPPDVSRGARLTGLRFAAAEATRRVIPREEAMGAVLVFEPGN